MIYNQLPTNKNTYVFWPEDSNENTIIMEIDDKEINFHQMDSWISVPREVMDVIFKILKRNKCS